jgi:hypothetical protein
VNFFEPITTGWAKPEADKFKNAGTQENKRKFESHEITLNRNFEYSFLDSWFDDLCCFVLSSFPIFLIRFISWRVRVAH